MDVKAAAPALARHLHAPLVRAEDAVALIRALAVLGEETEAALILEFFLAYRTVGGDPDFADAIAEAGDFAWRRGSEADRAQVDKAAGDTLTHPEVKTLLVQKLKTKKKKLPRAGERSPSALPVDVKEGGKSPGAAPKRAAEAKPRALQR